MQGLWNVAPWMRRRAQRHLERGGSARLLPYILNAPPAESARPVEPVPSGEALKAHNIILFRALKACQ